MHRPNNQLVAHSEYISKAYYSPMTNLIKLLEANKVNYVY